MALPRCSHEQQDTPRDERIAYIDGNASASKEILTRHTHDPHFLFDLVSKCLPSQRGSWARFSRSTNQLLGELHFRLKVPKPDLEVFNSPPKSKAVLRDLLRLFDRTYFFGLLGSHVDLVVFPDNIPIAHGFVTGPLSNGKLALGFKGPLLLSVKYYMGVLLHRMCHAFFMLYACRRCYHTLHNNGHTGHGAVWQLLAHAIENEVPKTEITRDIRVSLHRFVYLADELALVGVKHVDEALLKSYGLSMTMFPGMIDEDMDALIARSTHVSFSHN